MFNQNGVPYALYGSMLGGSLNLNRLTQTVIAGELNAAKYLISSSIIALRTIVRIIVFRVFITTVRPVTILKISQTKAYVASEVVLS